MKDMTKWLKEFKTFLKTLKSVLFEVFLLFLFVMEMIHRIRGILQLYLRTHRLVFVQGDVFVYEENNYPQKNQ